MVEFFYIAGEWRTTEMVGQKVSFRIWSRGPQTTEAILDQAMDVTLVTGKDNDEASQAIDRLAMRQHHTVGVSYCLEATAAQLIELSIPVLSPSLGESEHSDDGELHARLLEDKALLQHKIAVIEAPRNELLGNEWNHPDYTAWRCRPWTIRNAFYFTGEWPSRSIRNSSHVKIDEFPGNFRLAVTCVTYSAIAAQRRSQENTTLGSTVPAKPSLLTKDDWLAFINSIARDLPRPPKWINGSGWSGMDLEQIPRELNEILTEHIQLHGKNAYRRNSRFVALVEKYAQRPRDNFVKFTGRSDNSAWERVMRWLAVELISSTSCKMRKRSKLGSDNSRIFVNHRDAINRILEREQKANKQVEERQAAAELEEASRKAARKAKRASAKTTVETFEAPSGKDFANFTRVDEVADTETEDVEDAVIVHNGDYEDGEENERSAVADSEDGEAIGEPLYDAGYHTVGLDS